MRKPRADGQVTRSNLLLAAGRIFAEKGFRDATIADICQSAKANQAAANYHFGSKETLYVESWRFSFERSLRKYPPDGGVPPGAPVEERLRGRILALMQRIVDPQSHEMDIIYKELANPTGLLTHVLAQALDPIFKGFRSIVTELLGPESSERWVRLCLMSIRAQCFGPLMYERRRKMKSPPPGPGHDLGTEDVQTLADHVTRFSLAGILAVHRHVGHRDENVETQQVL